MTDEFDPDYPKDAPTPATEAEKMWRDLAVDTENKLAAAEARVGELEKEVERLTAALFERQWNGYRGPLVCENCFNTRDQGHTEDCPFAALKRGRG